MESKLISGLSDGGRTNTVGEKGDETICMQNLDAFRLV